MKGSPTPSPALLECLVPQPNPRLLGDLWAADPELSLGQQAAWLGEFVRSRQKDPRPH